MISFLSKIRGKSGLRSTLTGFFLFLVPMFANGFSLSLDSIATWGKFPRFCVNTYYWGDRFFNGYDTTYVKGTGMKFNVKLKTESWIDQYSFVLNNDSRINMISDPSTGVGVHLTYLAVSVGYELNLNKYLHSNARSRKRFNFSFNCALFAADLFYHDNTIGTTIKHFGPKGETGRTDIDFTGIDNKVWGLDLYYFLNNKRYSQAASFNFSRIQRKSQGSWYFGFSYWNQRFHFDFAELSPSLKDQLPTNWDDYTFGVKTKNYALKIGYGYNWVLGRHWVAAISESPMLGISNGITNDIDKTSFSACNLLRLAAVYNHGRFFTGIVGRVYTSLVRETSSTMVSNMFSLEISAGYRFNLW